MKMNELTNRLKGTIYGQAVGDALGLGTEGMTDEDMAWKYPNGISHYSDIFQDRHRKRWKIGDWTDDTDMMLCIANAVIKDKGVNLTSIARNFKEWADGEPMGIGETTYKVLSFGDYVEKPFDASKMLWEMSHQQSAANGGVMRTSIVGLFPKAVEECAVNICRLTHYDPRCVGSCAIVSLLIHSLVYEEEKLSYHKIVDIAQRYDSRIREYIDLSLNTDIRALELQDWDSVGYTLKTLAAGLWAYWNAPSFEGGLLSVVRAGGDADTNAAVACAILGAKFGFSAIPQEYIDGLIHKEQLDEVVSGMVELSK
jgi:ADP-ribosylglycohydrolase